MPSHLTPVAADAQPSANASKGNDLTKVTVAQYEQLRDLWPDGWCDSQPPWVAEALKVPADSPLHKARPRGQVHFDIMAQNSCRHIYTKVWRRSVCKHFGLELSAR